MMSPQDLNGPGNDRRRSSFRATGIGAAVAGAIMIAPAASAAAPKPKPKAPVEEVKELPSPQLTLKVSPAASGSWRLSIENTGDGPIRLSADPRLLILELSPPEAPRADDKKRRPPPAPPVCILPADTRPSSDDVAWDLVIPASRSWSTSFDPLFYCFGARERAALVAGTSVKARFGFMPPRARGKTTPKAAAPFVATPVGASVGKVGPLKIIDAAPLTLTDAVVVDPPATPAENVKLSMPESMDVARGFELSSVVTLTNGTDRPMTLLYRSDSVLFSVTGPNGKVACGAPRQVTSPIRELFTTIAVKGRADVGVMFSATCPAGTFDEVGLYRVLPKLDTTQASGRAIGLRSWDGTAEGQRPLLLRVRNPRKISPPPRPTLD